MPGFELLRAMLPKHFLRQTRRAARKSALCLPSAIRDNEFIKGMEAVEAHVVAHFHKSGPAAKKPKSFEGEIGLRALKLKTILEVRWLSRFERLNALSKSSGAIFRYFDEKATAGDIISRPAAASFEDHESRRTMEMFLDILSIAKSLNPSFQKDSIESWAPKGARRKYQ